MQVAKFKVDAWVTDRENGTQHDGGEAGSQQGNGVSLCTLEWAGKLRASLMIQTHSSRASPQANPKHISPVR